MRGDASLYKRAARGRRALVVVTFSGHLSRGSPFAFFFQ